MEKKKEHKPSGSVVVTITVDIIGKGINLRVTCEAPDGADERAIEIGRQIAKMNSTILGHVEKMDRHCGGAGLSRQPEKGGAA